MGSGGGGGVTGLGSSVCPDVATKHNKHYKRNCNKNNNNSSSRSNSSNSKQQLLCKLSLLPFAVGHKNQVTGQDIHMHIHLYFVYAKFKCSF